MANDNNNGIVMIKWVLGIIVTGLFVLVGNVVANDQRNTVGHQDIKKVMIERDEEMQSDIHEFRIEQMRQGTILERIDQKL